MDRLGKYRIIRELGHGATGVVYEGFDDSIQRTVAIKTIRADLLDYAEGRQALQRFQQEAQVAGQLSHPHIVTIYEFGVDQGVNFIAMEYLKGRSLQTYLDRHVQLNLKNIAKVMSQLLAALSYLHSKGFVHRDVKPPNILITEGGTVKLTDFGVARLHGPSNRTEVGVVIGTPSYMSPEQCQGTRVDGRSDLFSAGVVMYELLTGVRPFVAESVMTLMRMIIDDQPRKPSEVSAAVPPVFDALLSRALAKQPDERYQTAMAFYDDLKRVMRALREAGTSEGDATLGMLTTRMQVPTPGEQTLWRMQRRKWLAGLAAGGALAAAGLAWWRPWQTTAAPEDAVQPLRYVGRGVSHSDVVFGMSAAFSGPTRELGRSMEIGIQAAFRAANAAGGVSGRQLRLISLDDARQPEQALRNVQELLTQRRVLGFIGSVGTEPVVAVARQLSHERVLLFGPYTGSPLLRLDPPSRYIFHVRASYVDEGERIVDYLVRMRGIDPGAVGVFLQLDGYGEAGWQGVIQGLRRHGVMRPEAVYRVGHARGSLDMSEPVRQFLAGGKSIKAVVVASIGRPSALFIAQVRAQRPDLLFFALSPSHGMSEVFREVGLAHAKGVMATQIVPHVDSSATGIIRYRQVFQKHFPSEPLNFVNLEGYVVGSVMVEALRRAGEKLSTEQLVDTLEAMRGLDLGLGMNIDFSSSNHQASRKVWGTVLDEEARYQVLDLDRPVL